MSLDSPILDGETILMDTVENHKAADGEKNTRAKLLDEMIRKQLNERELLVYEYRIKGYDYEEIAHFTCLTTKQVDNALQSIKKKTRAIIENK